jgi:peptidoglycan hydrolase-like protein with peptidoglycan-binding domain
MSDLGPASDLTGKAGEEASKAASQNKRDAETEAKPRKRPSKAEPKDETPSEKPQEPRTAPKEAQKVFLSAAVYKNPVARKSYTVHLIQQKLHELGYSIAYSDRDGYFGDLTAQGVADFQRDKQIEATGRVDEKTLRAIFEDDERVELVVE